MPPHPSLTPLNHWQDPTTMSNPQNLPEKVKSFKLTKGKIEVPRVTPRADPRDAVEVYGSEVAAIAALVRQLAAVGEDLDKTLRRAAEGALALLRRGHEVEQMPTGLWRAKDTSAGILAEAAGVEIRFGGSYGSRYSYCLLSDDQLDRLTSDGFIINRPTE